MTASALAMANGDGGRELARRVEPSVEMAAIMERVLIAGDLAELEPAERIEYYRVLCRSLGLNPYVKPFEYVELDGKLTLYTTRNCTDQLRQIHRCSARVVSREFVDDLYVVTAMVIGADGRTDEALAAVPLVRESGVWKTNEKSGKRYFEADGKLTPLRPAERANALMKCETKAKRRATLSLIGLSFPDETELETIAAARRVSVDHQTGEIRAEEPNRRQLAAIFATAREMGLSDAAVHALAGVDSLNDLRPEEAVDLLAMLKNGDASALRASVARMLGDEAAAVPPAAKPTRAKTKVAAGGGDDAATVGSTWTVFWEWARGRGHANKEAVERLIGQPLGGLSPDQARDLVVRAEASEAF